MACILCRTAAEDFPYSYNIRIGLYICTDMVSHAPNDSCNFETTKFQNT